MKAHAAITGSRCAPFIIGDANRDASGGATIKPVSSFLE